jgi:hypothetical protein
MPLRDDAAWRATKYAVVNGRHNMFGRKCRCQPHTRLRDGDP